MRKIAFKNPKRDFAPPEFTDGTTVAFVQSILQFFQKNALGISMRKATNACSLTTEAVGETATITRRNCSANWPAKTRNRSVEKVRAIPYYSYYYHYYDHILPTQMSYHW